MKKVELLNLKGEKVKDINLNEEIFGITPNNNVLHDAIILSMASLRQGTHKTKNRSEVSGGGRKPWRQKGTGRARQGSIRSPQWRGGGVVFAPTPRSHAVKVNKKVVKLAVKNLWKKKFRYLVMLLVCAISLAFLSFTIELNGNPLRQNVFTMVENGYQYTEIKRYVPITDTSTHDFYAKYNYGDLPEDSYSIIKEGVPELTLHKYETVEIKYAGAYIENKNYFYTGVINTLIEYDKTNTYKLLVGRTPKEHTQEIMISDYLISALQYFD